MINPNEFFKKSQKLMQLILTDKGELDLPASMDGHILIAAVIAEGVGAITLAMETCTKLLIVSKSGLPPPQNKIVVPRIGIK